MRYPTFIVLLVGYAIFLQCRLNAEEVVEAQGSVPLKISECNTREIGGDSVLKCLATHTSQGKTARFRIELVLKKPKADQSFVFSTGSFLREPGSDSVIFLKQLSRVLEVKNAVSQTNRIDKLSFSTAILGQNLSRGKGKDVLAGSFTSNPKGDWIATKVFVANGEGEFFLNLNPKSGDGEISIKDPEYGDIVLAELLKVL